MKNFDYKNLSDSAKQTVFDSLTDSKIPFFVMENDKILFANPAWINFAGKFGDDLENGHSLRQSLANEIERIDPNISDEKKAVFVEQFSTAMRNGHQTEYLSDNGRLYRGVYTNSGSDLISGMSFDLSELREKRAEAEDLRARLEATLDGLQQGVLLYGLDGQVLYINKMMQEWGEGLGVEIKKGMSHNAVTHQMDMAVQGALSERRSLSNFEFVQTIEDGRTFLFEGRFLKGTGTLISAIDISDLQNALESAETANKAKTSFLANMSHEIRTPMNGVLGMAQVLEQMDVNEDQKNCIKIIKQSSELLLNIINDILDISKLDAEKVSLDLESFCLNELIQSAAEIIRPETAAKGLDLVLDMPNFETHYLGDQGKIRQIILNLLSNAVKFTHTGFVKLSVRDEGRVCINVEDSGIGIDPEKMDLIFERFEQSDNSTTREFGGTGLGLAIAKSLTELMQGEIKGISKPEQGTCFELTIPIPKVQKIQSQDCPISFRDFEDTPVLIIDDIEVNHMVVANQLKPLKLKPFFVKSADKGLHVLRSMNKIGYKVPLVICDYKMPKKTGYDFAKELKNDPELSDIPIIILSSADLISRKRDFIELGIDKVFEKPCNTQNLIKAVSECLSQNIQANKPILQEQRPISPVPKTPISLIKNILVADDDAVNRQVFESLLTSLGYKSTLVENGLQAVQACRQQIFDVILMDISMPILNGIEATQKIVEHEKRTNLPHTPIIAVTAHALKGDKEEFLSSGMDDYLAKPVRRNDLEIVLTRWLSVREKLKIAS